MTHSNGQSESRSRHMFHLAVVLLILAFLLFLCQLVNLGTFTARASEADTLPISIRATSQADYSRDPRSGDIPAISENILIQIITDVPAVDPSVNRVGTLRAALSSPVPTMTPDGRFPASSPASSGPTVTPLEPTPAVTASLLPTQTLRTYPTATFASQPYNPPVSTATRTSRPANTSIPAFTATATRTPTPTRTASLTPTVTASATPSSTSSPTLTFTPTYTPTDTPTVTPSPTLTFTPTYTPTDTPTVTPSPTLTFTPTYTPTDTPTVTPSPTLTFTPTYTPTDTPITTPSPTLTFTPTYTPTDTPTVTPSPTLTFTPTYTPTDTPTVTPSPTLTFTPTNTYTPTTTFTPSPTATAGLPACYPGTPNGLLPSDDSYIKGDSAGTNFGSDNSFDVRPDNGADRRGLLKFDLSSIPSNGLVTNATLYLYEQGNKSSQVTHIYRVTSDWNESTVTWNSWASPGGDFDGGTSHFSFIPDQKDCMVTLDITTLVQTWVNGTFDNYGLMLYSLGPNGIITYSSKEDGTASRRPKLDITYLVPPTHTPTLTPSPTSTLTPTFTPPSTPTSTLTFTSTSTPTYTPTLTPAYTPTFTPEPTATWTPVPSPTPTNTPTPD